MHIQITIVIIIIIWFILVVLLSIAIDVVRFISLLILVPPYLQPVWRPPAQVQVRLRLVKINNKWNHNLGTRLKVPWAEGNYNRSKHFQDTFDGEESTNENSFLLHVGSEHIWIHRCQHRETCSQVHSVSKELLQRQSWCQAVKNQNSESNPYFGEECVQ